MLIADDFIYIALHKTGSTYVESILKKISSKACMVYEKHSSYAHLPEELQQNFESKIKIGNIRNPWDWYVSLWAYGCQKGGIFAQRLMNTSARTIYRAQNETNHQNRFGHDVALWRELYSDPLNREYFRIWLRLVLGAHHSPIGELYKEQSISKLIGFFTYRYLMLYTYRPKEAYHSIRTWEELVEYNQKENYIDYFISFEDLKRGLPKVADKLGIKQAVLQSRMLQVEPKVNASLRKEYAWYYDEETADLVAKKDRLIIKQHDYEFLSTHTSTTTRQADTNSSYDSAPSLHKATLSSFIRSNSSYERYFVFHLGKRTFFDEITTVARAAIYAHCHKLQLVLCNDGFSYKYERGWEDYFQSFCQAYHPSMEDQVAVHCRSGKNRNFMGALISHRPEHLTINQTTLRGFDQIFRFFLQMLCQPISLMQEYQTATMHKLGIEGPFMAFHVPNTNELSNSAIDKVAESYLKESKKKIKTSLPLLILTEDYRMVKSLRRLMLEQKKLPVFSLCHPNAQPQHIGNTGKLASSKLFYKKAVIALSEALLASKSESFIGVHQSNTSKTIHTLHQQQHNCALLRPQSLK
ncbi:MAG: hypothetical protein AAF798_07190 [Bacteroidota bacterium]